MPVVDNDNNNNKSNWVEQSSEKTIEDNKRILNIYTNFVDSKTTNLVNNKNEIDLSELLTPTEIERAKILYNRHLRRKEKKEKVKVTKLILKKKKIKKSNKTTNIIQVE